jgi:predicted N-formylglutamate amidohydrolase
MIVNNFINIKKKHPQLPLLFCCDHASNLIPNQYKKLGLKRKILESHIAYDIGAKILTKKLTKIFKTNAVMGKYSRLFIDLNRDKSHINLIAEDSDGIKIPGNKNLSKSEISFRINKFYKPYHKELELTLKNMDKLFSCKTTLICIHSFTLFLQNKKQRPWEIGLLYRNDKSLYKPIIEYLNNYSDFKIGKNKPYSGFEDVNFTMTYHGELNKRPFISLEIRNDFFSCNNLSKLDELVIKISRAIYYSQIKLEYPYNIFAKRLNLF